MIITVRYFAKLRDLLKISNEQIEINEKQISVEQLRQYLINVKQRQAIGEIKNCRFAVNQQMAKLDTVIINNDEVAFFPPVTGG